jgi:hypothetical protein
MLSVAAVIGAVVDVELLRDVLGHQNQFEFLDALDLLLARQILNETGQARRVTFSHDLIRTAAIERQSSAQQTQRLHEAVALRLETLAGQGKAVSNAKLAEHFLSADIRDKAHHYLLQAGTDAVSAFAHRDAIPLLEKARQIMPAGTAASQEYQLDMQLAKAYAAIARRDRNGTGWIDSYREVHLQRMPDEASFNGFKRVVNGSRIDFIFHSAELKAISATIERDRSPEGKFASDHYAVTAVLEYGN